MIPPIPDGYMVPSRDYMDRLIRDARLAHVRATNASNDYNRLAEQAEDRARGQTVGRTDEERRLAVKFARKGVTEIGDAERQYLFWKGEQERLCAIIEAEMSVSAWMDAHPPRKGPKNGAPVSSATN
jgi:hypothetical protein